MKAKPHVVSVIKSEVGWLWHRQAANGKIISWSAETYKNKKHAEKMAIAANSGDCLVRVEDGK